MLLNLTPKDMVITQGQDFAIQVVISDHRGDPVPYSLPAQMTCKDQVGQTAFTTTMDSETGDEAMITTSEMNGLIQVTVPRKVTAKLPAGMYVYDIWATLNDAESSSIYPEGQQSPVVSGKIYVSSRVTVLEEQESTE